MASTPFSECPIYKIFISLQLRRMIFHMQIKKRLSLAQSKRHALFLAGISPSQYGMKKSTQTIRNKKKSLNTRKQKHRLLKTDL